MRGRYWTAAQRQALESELRETGDAALFRRLLALLEIDQGRSVTQVAQELRVGRSSVYRWAQRYAAAGRPAALEHRAGQGRPPKWNRDLESLLESALAQPPLHIGYPANGWTLPLLKAFLAVYLPGQEVSTSTLRRHLRELGYRWKRFRYTLKPDPQEEKKTPYSAPNSGPARANRAPGPG
jgi:transposase